MTTIQWGKYMDKVTHIHDGCDECARQAKDIDAFLELVRTESTQRQDELKRLIETVTRLIDSRHPLLKGEVEREMTRRINALLRIRHEKA